jgi:ankyrin repeat protein
MHVYQTIIEILELELPKILGVLPPPPPPVAKKGPARPQGRIRLPPISSPRNWPSGHPRQHSSFNHNLLPTSINKPKAPPNRLHATRVDICDLKGETALQIFFKSVNKYQNTSHATDVAIGMLRMTTKAELDRQFPDGSRFFCLAIAMKNDRLIKELYKLGVDTQCRDGTPDVRSPLELFCINGVRGDVEILRELIKACKNLAECDIKGMGLIHLASDRGHLTVVKELVDGGLDINHRASDGGTALVYSVGAGHTSIVDYLLENGARIDESRTAKLYWMSSIVSRVSNVATCRLLEDRGVNDWNEQTECQLFFAQFIPGLSATRTGASETSAWISPILRRLTPLHHYALRGFVDVLRYVVEHHTDVNIDAEAEFGIRPLFLAVLGKRLSTARYLIERGAKLDGVYKPTQWTMLHLAAHIGELEIVTTLLEHGAGTFSKPILFLSSLPSDPSLPVVGILSHLPNLCSNVC